MSVGGIFLLLPMTGFVTASIRAISSSAAKRGLHFGVCGKDSRMNPFMTVLMFLWERTHERVLVLRTHRFYPGSQLMFRLVKTQGHRGQSWGRKNLKALFLPTIHSVL